MFFENVTNNVELETSERLKLIVISNSHKTFAVAWSSLANVALYTGKRYSNGSLCKPLINHNVSVAPVLVNSYNFVAPQYNPVECL